MYIIVCNCSVVVGMHVGSHIPARNMVNFYF